jgi:signal transduction histidine kinase
MDFIREIESLLWFIIAIPISFVLIILISNLFLKIVTTLSRLNTKLIIVNVIIVIGIFFGIAQIYFLWKESDLNYTRQIIIAIYGTLCLMSGFGNILNSMDKTLIANKVAEKMNNNP